jgi:hypothetical protein
MEAEIKREEQISNDGKVEAQFRSKFAEAFLSESPQISGSFDTKYGVLAVEQYPGRIVGTGKQAVPPAMSGGFLSMSNLLGLPTSSVLPPTIRYIRLEGSVIGRSARFTVSTREAPETLLSSVSPSIVEGLLILSADGASFELLEEDRSPPTIHRATKIDPPTIR